MNPIFTARWLALGLLVAAPSTAVQLLTPADASGLLLAEGCESEASLTVTAHPPDRGAVLVEPPPPYASGDVVTLTALAAEGSAFGGWSGGLRGSENPASLTVQGNVEVSARFVEAEGRLPKVSHLAPVHPRVLQLDVRQQRVERSGWQPYVPEPGDVIAEVNPPDVVDRWITRDGEVIGTLVGPEGDLYWPLDYLEGPPVDVTWADDAASYVLSSVEDANYGGGVSPTAVHRKSKGRDYALVDRDQRVIPPHHTLYLELPHALTPGATYTLSFVGDAYLGGTLPAITFEHQPDRRRSQAVHVNQVGFHPQDPHKVAFLSTWMGTGGPLSYEGGLAFSVRDASSGAVALSGPLTLQRAADEPETGDKNVNLADVYQLDFSELETPGTYVACVEGIGCSYPFPIESDVWLGAFTASARYLYHARSGIPLGPPYTEAERPRDHHPADQGGVVRLSTTPLMDTQNGLNGDDENNFQRLIDGLLPADQTLGEEAWGGYHDAGDWDRRVQHLETSVYLIDLAELHPAYFDSVSLGIPESGGTYPDVIDEALFNIDLYRRLQITSGEDAGGVRGGIEHDSHPRIGEASWVDSNLNIAYAPDPWSSWLYAGTAAMAAHWMASRGFMEAATYEESARAAFAWAAQEDLSTYIAGDHAEVTHAHNFAAAALYRLTGEAVYHQAFLQTSVCADGVTNPLGQRQGMWLYLQTHQWDVDEAIYENCRQSYLNQADAQRAKVDETGFRWARPTGAFLALGTFSSVIDSWLMARAHALTGDATYLGGLELMAQTGLGANPDNVSYTTGLGMNPIRLPLHIDSVLTDLPTPAGITTLGPADESNFLFQRNILHKLVFASTYWPAIEGWPIIECYHDAHLDPLVTEFTVDHTVAPNFYAWGYLAAAPR